MQSPDDVLDSGNLPNPLADARLIRDHAQSDELIYLSLGETWTPPAQGLQQALKQIPGYAHGYTLSPYGLPALRNVLRAYIARTHRLAESDGYDVAVSQAGTRAAMADFATLFLARRGQPCSALIPAPGWDYAGLLAPLGFALRSYPLTAERRWQPAPELVEQNMDANTLLVLNPQHNPTGSEWSVPVVTRLIRAALERGSAILIDDAYYALHAPGHEPTNALHILIEHAGASSASLWLAARTLGKQFRCNGWGIGALTAAPQTLSALADIVHQRSYGSAQPLQAAMASWLQDPASDRYLEQIRQHYADNRRLVTERLINSLNFPHHAVHPGSCTSYMRFQVPPRFVQHHDEEHYRRLCLDAGVLPGRGSMAEVQDADGVAYVRLHLGHAPELLALALERLCHAGLGWQ